MIRCFQKSTMEAYRLSPSQSLFLCSDVYVFCAPSACSPVSSGLNGSAMKLHADWLGRCAYIPCCGSSTAPSLANRPQDCQGAQNAVERACDPTTGWSCPPLSVWLYSCPWCVDVLHGRRRRHTLASPVRGQRRQWPCVPLPLLTEGATLHGDSRPWTQKPL